jgi:hypothetical protein
MTKLQRCDLAPNNFTGLLPSAWSGMAALEYLDLSEMRLSGEMMESFATSGHNHHGASLNVLLWQLLECAVAVTYSTHCVSVVPQQLQAALPLMVVATSMQCRGHKGSLAGSTPELLRS